MQNVPERKSLKPPMVRVVGEIAIIVAGVLIALAVDSIVEARSERTLERSYLQRLAQDLAADSAEYDRQIEVERARGQQVRLLLQALDDGVGDGEAMIRAVEEAGWIAVLQLSPFTFRDLEATGNLRLIENPSVRESLARYYYHAIDNRDQIYEYASSRAWSYAQHTASVLSPDTRVRIGTGQPFDTAGAAGIAANLAELPLIRQQLSELLISTVSLERVYRYFQELAVAALNEVRAELDR